MMKQKCIDAYMWECVELLRVRFISQLLLISCVVMFPVLCVKIVTQLTDVTSSRTLQWNHSMCTRLR